MSTVVPKLCNLNGEIENGLWWIRTDCVAKADVMGMTGKCTEWAVNTVVGNAGWRAETIIPEGAAEELMVAEREMLDPVVEDVLMS